MKSVNDFYYICEDGHMTAGDTDRRTLCDQMVKDVRLTKTGKEVLKERVCGKHLNIIAKIPSKLDLFEVWDIQVLTAFMLGQSPGNLREGFLNYLQETFSYINERLKKLEGK